MTRLRKRADELLHRAMRLEREAQAFRAEDYHEIADRYERNAQRLRRKLVAAWAKMTVRRMSAIQ
jgi:catalase (peroxidase I)